MLLNFEDLPPGTTAEHVDLGPGRTFTFYHLPEPLSQGPEVRRAKDGTRCLLYMWNFYLFVWPEGTGKVSVYHGDINQHSDEPLWSFNIDRPWCAETLVARGQRWAVNNDSKFDRP